MIALDRLCSPGGRTRRRLRRLALVGSLLGCLVAAAAVSADGDVTSKATATLPDTSAGASTPGVNIAPYARAQASNAVNGTTAAGVNDSNPNATTNDLGDPWVAPGAGGTWVSLTWDRVQTVTTVQLVGTTGMESRILSGTLSFSDGSSLAVGQVVGNAAAPTTIAFEPRTVKWVRWEPTKVAGSGTLGLSEIRVYPLSATPIRATTADASSLADDPVNPACSTSRPATLTAGLVYVLCPVTSTRVKGNRTITFVASGLTKVTATLWTANATAPMSASAKLTSKGTGSVTIDFAKAPSGPVTVELKGTAGASLSDAKPTQLQLYNSSNGRAKASSATTKAPGLQRTLVYDQQFSSAISYSLDGRSPLTDYPAAKPEWWGTGQFGSAIFPDPAKGFDNLRIVDKRYLRITTQPLPAGYTDPAGWNRQYIGGMLASARAGGSGFSAQYGYFEARILVPGNAGTWPAFWLLPSTNLIAEESEVAEIDAVELYGHDPTMACSSTHHYKSGKDDANTQCIRPFASTKVAAGWHTYGVDVKRDSITYYIDGKATMTVPQVGAGDDPMFFLVNLDLGGGWPINLATVQNRSAMYVDYIRVWV